MYLRARRNNIQPEDCRRTDHHWTMHTFPKGANCSYCNKFLKGSFYQGYRCVRCAVGVHRDCIKVMPKCGTVHPPELPPRPPLLPIKPQPTLVEPLPVSENYMKCIWLISSFCSVDNLRFFCWKMFQSPGIMDGQRSPGRITIPSSPSSPPLPLNNLNSPCTSNGMRLPTTQPCHHYVNLNHLESYAWYAGELDRDNATNVLEEQPNGTFLVRVRPATALGAGAANDAAYALSLR